MATIASQLVLHPAVTSTLKVWSTTVGRDKTYRAVQYLARFLAWYVYRKGYSKETIDRWAAMKSSLGQGRKLMRVGKFIEHLQAALRASNNSDAVLKFTAVGRQLGYGAYLFTDMFVWAHAAGVRKLSPVDAKKLNERAMRFWFTGLAFSIASGLYASRGLVIRTNAAKRARASPEKEAERKAELKAIKAQTTAVRFQLTQDLLDILIPGTAAGYFNFDEGILGIAGLITSLMGLRTQARAVLSAGAAAKNK